MSPRQVVGRLGTAVLSDEAGPQDEERVLAALGGPVETPGSPQGPAAVPGERPDQADEPDGAPGGDAAGAHDTADLAPTGVWTDPDDPSPGPGGDLPGAPGALADEDAPEPVEEVRYPEPLPGSGRRRRSAAGAGGGAAAPSATAGSAMSSASAGSSASALSAATGAYGVLGDTSRPAEAPGAPVAPLAAATRAMAPPAPVVALLLVSTGEVVEVRGDVVLGRAPGPLPGHSPRRAAGTRLVTVPSPTQRVAPSHLWLSTAGANVLAQDLGSRGGTVLVREGLSPVLLASSLPTPLLVGDLLDVGDGVAIRLAPPR